MLMSVACPALHEPRFMFALRVSVCMCVCWCVCLRLFDFMQYLFAAHTHTDTHANTAMFIYQQTHQESHQHHRQQQQQQQRQQQHAPHTCAWCAFNFYGGSRLDSRLRCPDWFVYPLAHCFLFVYVFMPTPPCHPFFPHCMCVCACVNIC